MKRAVTLSTIIAVGITLESGCHREVPVTHDPVAPVVASAHSTSAPSVSAKASASASASAPVGPFYPSPRTLVPFGDGALAVFVDAEDGAFAIMAQPLDARGAQKAAGSTILASEEATALDGGARNGIIWLAWRATIGGTSTVRALRIDGDVTNGRSGPYSIVSPLPASDSDGQALRVLTLADGGAIVVTSAAETAVPCTPGAHPPEVKACSGPSFAAFGITPKGVVRSIFRKGVDGGAPLEIQGVVETASEVVISANGWNGGPTLGGWRFPLKGGAASSIVAECRPPFQLAYTGTALVQLCPGDYEDASEKCPIEHDGLCFRIVDHPFEAGKSTRSHVKSLEEHCVGGRFVTDVEREDASTIRLDQGASGASIRLEAGAIWTGEALLRLSNDGAIEKRVCVGDALVGP